MLCTYMSLSHSNKRQVTALTLLIVTAELKTHFRRINRDLVAYRVKVQEGLVMLSLRGQSLNGTRIFIICQVEVRKGGDHWGTYVRRGEFRGETIREVTTFGWTKNESRAYCISLPSLSDSRQKFSSLRFIKWSKCQLWQIVGSFLWDNV